MDSAVIFFAGTIYRKERGVSIEVTWGIRGFPVNYHINFNEKPVYVIRCSSFGTFQKGPHHTPHIKTYAKNTTLALT